jgi:hypothetical protein
MEVTPVGPFSGVLYGVFYGIRYEELIIPICLMAWSTLLFVSLGGIELTDAVTASTYVAFSLFLATIVALAIPSKLIDTTGPGIIIRIFVISTFFAAGRWLLAYRAVDQKWRAQISAARSEARGKQKGR